MLILVECMNRYQFRPRGIVHAGAHYGEEVDWYLSLQPDLLVWIEGDPTLMPGLQSVVDSRRNRATRQIAIQALITDQDDADVEFHRFSNDGASSSIFRGTELLRETWPGLDETGEVLKLKSCRLETALKSRGLLPQQIDTLVIDLQGAELLALAGAGEFLKSAQFVEVEVSEAEFYSGGALASQLDEFLSGNGFERISPLYLHGDTIYRRVR